MNAALSVLLGLLLRIGIPVAITILVVILLRRLDEKWQKESRALPLVPGEAHCWEVTECPIDQRQKCAAMISPEGPCWQVFRSKDGDLNEACLDCKVFQQASVPGTV